MFQIPAHPNNIEKESLCKSAVSYETILSLSACGVHWIKVEKV
jgi:hypothetical protein